LAELISIGPFATEGERKAANVLRQLPDSWLVICNKILPTKDGRSFEIDFIVVGQRWIFVLDEKSWRGSIRGNEEQWIRSDGSAERSPLAKADYVAKILAGYLGWKVPALAHNGHFVRGGVLLSALERLPQIHDPRAPNGLFRPADVCLRLQALDRQQGNPQVGQMRNLIKAALVGLMQRPPIPESISLYTIQDVTPLRPGVRLCHACFEGNPDLPRWLMIYELGRDALDRQEQYVFYTQEFHALKRLYAFGLVPETSDPFPWGDDYFVLPIVPPAGKSLSAYPLPETREEFGQDLLLASAAFKGLDQIHNAGVLHRALGPEAIYVQSGAAPKVIFTNFYAARVGNQSIALSLDALSLDDPYAHEDLVIGYGYATQQTDTFSLALVFLERLSGAPISAIRANVDSPIIFPEKPRWSSFLPAELADELTALFKQILLSQKGTEPLSAVQIATRLQELARRLRVQASVEEKQTLMGGRYKVLRLLGQGMMARTYLIDYAGYELMDPHVAKQFLHPSEVYQQAVAEYKALREIDSSKYVPRIIDILQPQDEIHIRMQYIPGDTLQQVESEFPWPLERWWPFAEELLKAINVLEQAQILHRDIKPANIILHASDNHPVLIDFGFAIQRGEATGVAGTPLYLPTEALNADQPPPSSDRYAAAVVLFKALTGMLPFVDEGRGQRTPVAPEQIEDAKLRRIARVLLRAVSADPAQRPVSAEQMIEDLRVAMQAAEEPIETEAAGAPLPEMVNPWVDSIRGLYRNSASGNADNRGLDSEFVRETYVPTALDEHLLPGIFEHLPRAVFLSGNPGDGKTAFLEQVQQELRRKGATPVEGRQDPSGWEWLYRGHTFRSCYDASEAHAGMSADEQLTEKLSGLEGADRPESALTVLVAINDGRLADYFARNRKRFPWLAQQLDRAQNGEVLEDLAVWVIDLKKRAFVNLPAHDGESIFRRVLLRLVDPKHWALCNECAARSVCPLYRNAQELNKPRVLQRLEFLLSLTHLRHQRHITMRDLRSALAYLVTANQSCEQIHAARNSEDGGSSLIDLHYWQTAFAQLEDGDDLLKDLRTLDPARFPQPHLDRFLHFHQNERDVERRRKLFIDQEDLPRLRFRQEAEWLAACKRRLYFNADKLAQEYADPDLPEVRWLDLLPYRYARTYIKLLDRRAANIERVRERLALGILRSDGINVQVPPDRLSVVVRASEQQQLIILKQIPLEEFELRVQDAPQSRMIETLPECLVLEHRSGTPRLEISLDLFELLMRMADGMQPDAPEFQPLLDDLRLFKDTLLLLETRDLILIEGGRRVHHITQSDGKIVRSALA
jgi:serine/threonine protein kinase